MHKVFISGSISIDNLDAKVIERIGNIVESNYQVLIGDAGGVDSAIQKHLLSRQTNNVVVYCAGEEPRNNLGNWIVERISTFAKPGSRAFFTSKDLKMAEVCDYGLMIWDTKSTGTLANILELLKQSKYSLVFINKKKTFKAIKNVEDFQNLLEIMSESSLKKAEEKLKLNIEIDRLKFVQSEMF
ncbi:hypothetical protein SAMN05192566_1566 [Methylophilus rhizosphaerae]|uniref:Uncharacterized protein n=1 Tax=Methylophilus rhizosphaerae TaxID=492660 RepID=A0A1G9CPV3_9PROT|nr:hypothetical protein [Methylophilus rhizosphaerae]SDK53638.1 hypothetical protein SAMN05192566_1566 [Methylophilus rhizosphaerae]